jgi:AraC-like DNA-binding protein
MDRRILILKEQILSNLKKQNSVEKMALSVDISASHLHRLFKAETGLSLASYIRNLRLEKARELLENSFKHIKEIRFEVGLRDQSHFTRDFKAKFGVTPSEYRKQHWAKLEAEKSQANKR